MRVRGTKERDSGSFVGGLGCVLLEGPGEAGEGLLKGRLVFSARQVGLAADLGWVSQGRLDPGQTHLEYVVDVGGL